MKPTPPPGITKRRPSAARVAGRILFGLFGAILLLAVGLYVTLLFTPIPLPFLRDQARSLVVAALPSSSSIELGDVALALEGGTWPVLQFSPVKYMDSKTGATVRMSALEIGFSPIRALIGQPGATITVVEPRLQINQDLFGPRLATFEVVQDPASGTPTVRVLEGADAFPSFGIGTDGIAVKGELPEDNAPMMRSDNDWLLYNLEGMAQSVAAIIEQAKLGRFSRLIVRDGTLEMNDALYGLFRVYHDINVDITMKPDGDSAAGPFSLRFGSRTMQGSVERLTDADGSPRLRADITNVDFASFMPFIDDPDSIVAVQGGGAVSLDMKFAAETGKLTGGTFRVDMTGTELRVNNDHFPIVTSIIQVDWEPATAQFTMAEAEVSIGKSSGKMQGVFVLGLDKRFGPNVAMSIKARDVLIQPNDLPLTTSAFTNITFEGWSAPLYGATGIDLFRAEKEGAWIETKGRTDIVRKGLGFDMTIVGEGLSADDLKRLWPYFISGETRSWFVANVSGGRILQSTMKYKFPIGTVGTQGDDKPLPPDSVSINMAATGVEFKPLNTMIPVAIEGKTQLWVRDTKFTVSADGATVGTEGGNITFANAALVMDSEKPGEQLVEISGDISGDIKAIVALAKQQQPDAMANAELPLDLEAIAGNVSLALVSTIVLDENGKTVDMDYAINGSVQDFGSTKPIETHTISDGVLSFVASQEGYRFAGQAKVDGITADLVVEGAGVEPPTFLLSSTLQVADLKKVGFDVSEFLSGAVKFVAKPMSDGTIQLAVDIADAALNIKDLGVSKKAGVPGLLEAQVKQTGTMTELTRVNLAFGNVNLKGSLDYDLKEGLVSADFTTFALSEGDDLQAELTKIAGGYQMKIRGEQFDLKPMLNRFFGLNSGAGGPQATAVDTTIVLDVKLDRVLGFYKSTAFNFDLGLSLKGSDLRNVRLQAQFGGGGGISVTSNPGPTGKITSVAFNDLGALLRMLNVYANMQGGEGSLVMQANEDGGFETGQLNIRNLAIVNEENIGQIINQHEQSRQALARNTMAFDTGRVDFVRRKDRFEIREGLLSGDSIGATIRGFVYTDDRRYDLTGTYVPLFGLNNMFQRLPILGPIIGGREGEGLIGVAFAVRGPLDKPDFQVNPASLFLPGVLRGLFEFRAREQPRAE